MNMTRTIGSDIRDLALDHDEPEAFLLGRPLPPQSNDDERAAVQASWRRRWVVAMLAPVGVELRGIGISFGGDRASGGGGGRTGGLAVARGWVFAVERP
jgi:hypothetical protein